MGDLLSSHSGVLAGIWGHILPLLLVEAKMSGPAEVEGDLGILFLLVCDHLFSLSL
jgi:hypothetical protein